MLKKVLVIILILTAVFIYTSNNIYAMDEIISKGDSFLSARNENPIDEKEVEETSDYIYNIFFTIAVVLAVAIGMVIGIQFIMGSVDEKAKIKETLVPYVVGVFVVFASLTIWRIAISIGEDVAPTPDMEESATEPPTTTSITSCPHCGATLHSNQILDLERKGSTTCQECKKTIRTT